MIWSRTRESCALRVTFRIWSAARRRSSQARMDPKDDSGEETTSRGLPGQTMKGDTYGLDRHYSGNGL